MLIDPVTAQLGADVDVEKPYPLRQCSHGCFSKVLRDWKWVDVGEVGGREGGF